MSNNLTTHFRWPTLVWGQSVLVEYDFKIDNDAISLKKWGESDGSVLKFTPDLWTCWAILAEYSAKVLCGLDIYTYTYLLINISSYHSMQALVHGILEEIQKCNLFSILKQVFAPITALDCFVTVPMAILVIKLASNSNNLSDRRSMF